MDKKDNNIKEVDNVNQNEMTPEELEAHNKLVDETALKVFKKYNKAFEELAKY